VQLYKKLKKKKTRKVKHKKIPAATLKRHLKRSKINTHRFPVQILASSQDIKIINEAKNKKTLKVNKNKLTNIPIIFTCKVN
jgi:hypothetical protein